MAPGDDVPEEQATHEPRWTGRPVVAFLLRAAAVVAPVFAGVLTAVVVRRLLPLETLYRMTLLFPDHLPSRYKIARRAGNVRQLQDRVAAARERGLDDDPTSQAETVLTLVTGLSHHDARTRVSASGCSPSCSPTSSTCPRRTAPSPIPSPTVTASDSRSPSPTPTVVRSSATPTTSSSTVISTPTTTTTTAPPTEPTAATTSPSSPPPSTSTPTPTNGAPVANGDGPVLVQAFGQVRVEVLTNDDDPDGDPLTVTIAQNPGDGEVTVNADGSITYSNLTSSGDDQFSYRVTDPSGDSDTAVVQLAVNDRPIALDDPVHGTNDYYAFDVTDSPTYSVPVRDNDSDPDGDTVSIYSWTQPGYGKVSCNQLVCVFDSEGVPYGTVTTFTYTIVDKRGGSDTATVRIMAHDFG